MKVKRVNASSFVPVTIEITFETEEEFNSMYQFVGFDSSLAYYASGELDRRIDSSLTSAMLSNIRRGMVQK